MNLLLLIIVFIGIAGLEVPKLLREHKRRELIVFSGFWVLGFFLCIGQLLGIPLPNPARIIARIFHIKY